MPGTKDGLCGMVIHPITKIQTQWVYKSQSKWIDDHPPIWAIHPDTISHMNHKKLMISLHIYIYICNYIYIVIIGIDRDTSHILPYYTSISHIPWYPQCIDALKQHTTGVSGLPGPWSAAVAIRDHDRRVPTHQVADATLLPRLCR